jgi:UDP-N-acetylglucosamine 4,6-dehydratase
MDWSDKVILLTGGTGSFGKKFTEIVLRHFGPKVIRIYSRDELKQHEMQTSPRFKDPRLRFLIGDVRDKERLHRAMEGVNIVVHAAALKQVPVCEFNPFEAVKTNVLGTANVIDVALDHEVERVMGISTDKAANPINLYGATKLCAEKIFTAANAYAGAKNVKISCVRYGNVVGSRGSVAPIFMEQEKNGSLTITDERMTRFWISIEQAVFFVAQCIEQMQGGEIFVPKIPSMKVMDLANAIGPSCEKKLIGIRPGEKIHEILLTEDEARLAQEFEKFYVVEPLYPERPKRKWEGGKQLAEGFRYSSDLNNWLLTTAELQTMIRELGGTLEVSKS